jgi:hypothetical protein
MDPNGNETLYRRAKIDGNALGDEIVFFDDRGGKYFATGQVGAEIWKLLSSPMSYDALVANLMTQYDVNEVTCRAETKDFLEKMIGAGLLEVAA